MPASNQFVSDTRTDFLFAFPDGCNSGIAPLILEKSQLAYASNATVRGNFVTNRPPWNKLTLDFGGDEALQLAVTKGLWQGGCYYRPDTGPETLMASIGGRLFQFIPNGLTATVFERTGGNPQNPTVVQAWLWQVEYYVFWNDGVNLTVFFDGRTNTTTRSVGNTNPIVGTTLFSAGAIYMPAIGSTFNMTLQAPYAGSNGDILLLESFGTLRVDSGAGTANLGATNLSIQPGLFYAPPMNLYNTAFKPQFPAGKMGAYGLGRVWMALANGKDFVAGDIVRGPSGTLANDFRDSVLFITENNFLFGGGLFTVPGSSGEIRAMIFTATLDVSLGQGPLQIFTPTSVFSCAAPVDRSTWTSLTNPILTQSLIGAGALGQNSTVAANGDTIFRSLLGLGSLILGRREFDTWGNVPISREVERVISTDPESLLPFGSAAVFDNRLLMSTHPVNSERGIYGSGVVVINFDPLSTIRGKAPSVWDGAWPGLNTLQMMTGEFALVNRCYSFSVNTGSSEVELWEVLPTKTTQFQDQTFTSPTPIYWFFESPVLFRSENPNRRDFLQLQNGEIYVDQLQGTVTFEAFYKPDQWPCWVPWLTWQECARNTLGQTDQPQFRPRMGLGTPSTKPCDPTTGRPFANGYTFQFKLIVTGHCRFLGAKFAATPLPEETFSPICKPLCS